VNFSDITGDYTSYFLIPNSLFIIRYSLFFVRGGFYFNQNLRPWQIRHCHSGSAGSGGYEKGIIDFIVNIEMGHVFQEYSDVDEMFHITAIKIEVVLDIFHDGLCLCPDVQFPLAINQFSASKGIVRPSGTCAGDKNPWTDLSGMRITPQGLSFVSGNDDILRH